MSPLVVHPYDDLIPDLQKCLKKVSALGLGQGLAKGKAGEILLAHHLGHTLISGDKGADAQDAQGNLYEYKVSHDNQFNFNFGPAGITLGQTAEQVIKVKFAPITGAYCAMMVDDQILAVAYCPKEPLVENLMVWFDQKKRNLINKNFSIDSFSLIPGAWLITYYDFGPIGATSTVTGPARGLSTRALRDMVLTDLKKLNVPTMRVTPMAPMAP